MNPEALVYSVELTDGAMEDLRAIREYIAEELQSPTSSQRTVSGILDVADHLSSMPFRNRRIATTGRGNSIRSARYNNYRLLYLVEAEKVIVFAVLYSASDVEDRLGRILIKNSEQLD